MAELLPPLTFSPPVTERGVWDRRQKWRKRQKDGTPLDPVARFVLEAQPVANIHPDPDSLAEISRKETKDTFSVLCLPCYLLSLTPCYTYYSMKPYEAFAQDRGLFLTDNGLIYREKAGATQTPINDCCAVCYDGALEVTEIYVLPNEDVELVLEGDVEDTEYAVGHIVLMVDGKLLARLDHCRHRSQFVSAVKAQTMKARQLAMIGVSETDFIVHKLINEYYSFIATAKLPIIITQNDIVVNEIVTRRRMREFLADLNNRVAAAQRGGGLGIPFAAPVSIDMEREGVVGASEVIPTTGAPSSIQIT